MASRVNFLVAAGVLTAMILVLLGRLLIVVPLAWLAPDWASVAFGAWLLIGLMLVVNLLSRMQKKLEKMAGGAQRRPPGRLGISGQALLYIGHILLLAAGYAWWSGEEGLRAPESTALAALLYLGGIAAALTDWRHRSP
jgi:hypothetical protein